MILKSLCLRCAADGLRVPVTLDAGTMEALASLLALQAKQIAKDGGSGGGKFYVSFTHACTMWSSSTFSSETY